jgi:hypothetical protein
MAKYFNYRVILMTTTKYNEDSLMVQMYWTQTPYCKISFLVEHKIASRNTVIL